MKTTLKQKLLIATTASLIAGGATLTASSAYAGPYGEGCNKGERGHKGAMMKHHGGFFGGKMNPKEMMEREFDKKEIRTLMEAKLLIRGNENLKVGKIKTTDEGYKVAIVTQDNSLVENMELAPNGMKLERFKRIQKHMEERKNRLP